MNKSTKIAKPYQENPANEYQNQDTQNNLKVLFTQINEINRSYDNINEAPPKLLSSTNKNEMGFAACDNNRREKSRYSVMDINDLSNAKQNINVIVKVLYLTHHQIKYA